MMLPGPVICIVGPTASGKSALADELALRLGVSVLSVDAMQVYRGMDIGTAKTPLQERRVPLEMVDVADVSQDYSVALFQREARAVIDHALSLGKAPILCGGTGLYLDAVVDEMDFPAGEVGDERRSRYEDLAQSLGSQGLWDLLDSRDQASARIIHPNNVRRVVRALELLDEGTSYAQQHEGLKTRSPHYVARIWGLSMPRERLYARIDRRVDLMFEQGLVNEVRLLCEHGLRACRTASQAIGYKEVIEYLDGIRTLDECRSLIKQRTRRYAKRQLSWLRRDGRARIIDLSVTGVDEACRLIIDDMRPVDVGPDASCGETPSLTE